MRQPIKPREIYMNIKQMKSMISKFRSADLSAVKDADMRAKAEKLQAKQAGFTLLELLVVVAILAIIAGAVISSLDGQEELAAQKTTVHTMAALENGLKVYNVTQKRLIPANLDSLLTTTATPDASNGTFTHANVAAGTTDILGAPNNSNVARVGGGLTADLANNMSVVSIASGAAGYSLLTDAGLTSLRYAYANVADDDEGTTVSVDGVTFGDEELVEMTKPNLVFRSPLLEDGEWEYGAGAEVEFDGSSDLDIAILDEAGEITGNEDDVVAIFGIGSDSALIGEIVARAPADGNAGPDKYGHFSMAVKIATCDESLDCTNTANWTEADDAEVVAILDAGGDAYDDEVAEARGNEEE
jgi:prepilin-type N-terminal cleavage/methylation domain-containing protein